jgi:NADPH:quinone reductase-like Zn-dependent oxidoreductase
MDVSSSPSSSTSSQSSPSTSSIPSTMRAVIYRNYGSTENLTLVDNHPIPKLTSKQSVLVKVYATSVNPVDWKMLEGYLSIVQSSRSFPFIPCFDVSGVVVEVGSGCRRIKPGDEVWAMAYYTTCGGCAEYVVLPEKVVAKKPFNLSHIEAASLPLVGETSYQALVHTAGLQKDQKILILGGSTATGSCAIQLAKHIGAFVAATCSTRNVELLEGLGADKVIDYTKEEWFEVLKGEEYDMIYDTVGGLDSWLHSKSILKPSTGIYVTIAGDNQTKISLGKALSVGSSILNRKFWSLFGEPRYSYLTTRTTWTDLYEIRKLVEDGAIRPVIDKVYSMEEVAQAFEMSKSGKARGKLVIRSVEDESAAERRDGDGSKDRSFTDEPNADFQDKEKGKEKDNGEHTQSDEKHQKDLKNETENEKENEAENGDKNKEEEKGKDNEEGETRE